MYLSILLLAYEGLQHQSRLNLLSFDCPRRQSQYLLYLMLLLFQSRRKLLSNHLDRRRLRHHYHLHLHHCCIHRRHLHELPQSQ